MSLETRLRTLTNAVAADIKSLRARSFDDTDWITDPSGIFSPSGWSIGTFVIRRTNLINVSFRLLASRTGGSITVGATGDIANTLMGTFAPEWRPSELAGVGGPVATGRLVAGYISNTTGQLQISAVAAGSGSMGNGTDVEVYGSYLLPKVV